MDRKMSAQSIELVALRPPRQSVVIFAVILAIGVEAILLADIFKPIGGCISVHQGVLGALIEAPNTNVRWDYRCQSGISWTVK